MDVSTTGARLTPTKPIDTTDEFLDWMTHLEDTLVQGQESKYSRCLELLRNRRDAVDDIIYRMNSFRDNLTDIQAHHRVVEEKTRDIQSLSDEILQEDTALGDMIHEIEARLAYFNDLEPITKLMHSPGENVCLDPDFIPYLGRLEECVDHLEANPTYKDAELYLMRWQQCLSRGLTLVKIYFSNGIRTQVAETEKKLVQITTGDSTAPLDLSILNTLLYVDFRTAAAKLQPLCYALETSALKHDEYQTLLQDCTSTYVLARSQLLSARVSSHLAHISQKYGQDRMDTIRMAFTFVMNLSGREYQLYFNFFTRESPSLSLCANLYNHFKPIIYSEPGVESLYEMYQTIQADIQSKDPTFGLHSDPVARTNHQPAANAPLSELQPFRDVVSHILDDVRARLVLRSKYFISQSIQRYTPTADDKRNMAGALAQDFVYLPLKDTQELLDKLQPVVLPSQLQGLANQAFQACIVALRALKPHAPDTKSPNGELLLDGFTRQQLSWLRAHLSDSDFDFHALQL
ncbi:Golgi transport complex subunit 3 [Dispira parvispora]|uniref:Conserved oligomeric Golgi complex subunit 3 n=1 Tax=Dispira parvispora TaxID=1520584 RepID=A0A9W8ARG6_9FUNG|nr:Golgi transport complex subunit 3 [Dispira parvispora]